MPEPTPHGDDDFKEWERQTQEEPSVADLIDACREYLTQDNIDLITQASEAMESDEDMGMGIALGLVFEILLEADIDPDEFLKQKGILE